MLHDDPPRRAAAEKILNYLAEVDAPAPAKVDAIIGFGVFDLKLPHFCAELFDDGAAQRIIFTGGIGAGTGDLGAPEAEAWRAAVARTHPHIPDRAIIVENHSTNTAENIRYTADLLARKFPALAFGTGICSAIIVASPSRLRRVKLTMRHLQPAVRIVRRLPPVFLDAEHALYSRQGVSYVAHLLGELERIATYPARGWISAEPIPAGIMAAADVLRNLD